jgi:hypothetical protein
MTSRMTTGARRSIVAPRLDEVRGALEQSVHVEEERRARSAPARNARVMSARIQRTHAMAPP